MEVAKQPVMSPLLPLQRRNYQTRTVFTQRALLRVGPRLSENPMALPHQLHRAIRAVGLAVFTPLLSPVFAQSSPRAVPATYAITNARIVPVSSATIEKGTIIVRDGLIAAVGATTVTIPGDARIIDGTGLTVYPGFIDAFGSIGMPSGGAAAAAARAGGGGRGAATTTGTRVGAANSAYPPGLQPEMTAIELLQPDAEMLSGPQSAGYTSALTVQGSGIFQGTSAVINLAGADVNAMIIRANVAQHIAFTPLRNGGFPNSLMGVFAALRQELLDAQHYRDEQAAYAKSPRGMKRPDFDPSLDALQSAIAGKQPVVMFASSQREIERALDLAKEFGLKPIIAGGSEAYLVAARLKLENVPVLLSANFPRRMSAPSADADPDPIRVLRERVEAPKGPGKLSQAGVRYALQSGGTNNWTDVLANVRRAMENGLTADQALRAMTVQPAEILGVADRLGTIETGKIANLTISRGDLFNRTGRVTQLFIDGKPIAVRATTAGESGAADNADANVATGTWTMSVNLDATDRTVTLSARQEGTRLLGSIQGMFGSAEINNGSVGADGTFRFSAAVTIKEGTEEATFVGSFEGNAVRGRLTIVGHAPGIFSGTRPARDGAAGRPRTPPPAR